MKIGLFGGTFNPFHLGHLGIIRHVREAFGLETVFLIPSATPPHKPNLNLAPASDRYEMVRLGIMGMAGLAVSDQELTRKGPSFTIDTIRAFKKNLGDTADFYLLMGSDAFLDIETWKLKDEIFDEIKIIVMIRGSILTDTDFISFVDEHISKGYVYQEAQKSFTHRTKQAIFICRVPRIEISSTLIRSRVKEGKTIEGLVPACVLDIIQKKDLYR